jgi:hypothetical protein
MEEQHYDALQELSNCRFLPGSWDRKFVRDLSSKPREATLSPKQVRYLKKLYYRYRRQIVARNPDAMFDWTFDADEMVILDEAKPPRPPRKKRQSGEVIDQITAIRVRYGKWTDKIADYWEG